MAANDRNNPARRPSSESQYSLMEFMNDYPDDAACLDALWRERYAPDGHHTHCPKCDRERKFHRTSTRASYTCDSCGHHIHPMAGTIFEKSTTSLQLWFYCMYLMASTRAGISAKQMERELGVTYKTAHRMMKKIRTELMADDGEQLSGDVEVDETGYGGKPRKKQTLKEAVAAREQKATVLAAVERGGRAKATVIASRRGAPLRNQVREWVDPSSIVITDEWPAYNFVKREFLDHSLVNHSQTYVTPEGDHTNTVEGFFGLMKPAMKGVYRKVSREYLTSYVAEYAWRYSARVDERPYFEQLLAQAVKPA